MKPETEEWITKAEGDLRTAVRESTANESPNYDAACFHAQQCAEKYLKARLVEGGYPVPKIHDLDALLNRVLTLEPSWGILREGLQQLTDMAVEIRYPGLTADADDAELAIQVASHSRKLARIALQMTA